MTPEVQIALIVAAAPTIAAIGAITISIIHDRRAGKKLDTITTVTNGTAARMQMKVDGLEALVRQLLVERSIAETRTADAAVVSVPPAPPA